MRQGWLTSGGLLLAALGTAACAQGSAVPPVQPVSWVISEDGAFVIDTVSRLAWPRCVEGMSWDAVKQTCTGKARFMTYGEALALSTARFKAEGVAWRIPRLTELRRFAAQPKAREFFPGDPADWTWTATLRIDSVDRNLYNYDNVTRGMGGTQDRLGVQQGWAIHMGTGETRGDVSRKTLMVVRLVRPAAGLNPTAAATSPAAPAAASH